MTSPPESAPTVRRITDQRAHLRVSSVGVTGADRKLATVALRNLWSLSRIDLQVHIGRVQSATRAERALAPEHPVLAIGSTALAIHRAAANLSSYDPAVASPATIRTLAVIPRVMSLHGDLAHLAERFRNLASDWLVHDWNARVLCAEPPTDDLMADRRDRELGLSDKAREERSGLAQYARSLASRAAAYSREVDVLIETDTASERVHVPILSPPGVALAAVAQWSEHLARRTPDDRPIRRDAALVQLGIILLQADGADVQRALFTTPPAPGHGAEIPRHALATFFEEALSDGNVIAQVARLNQLVPDTAHARLTDLRSELLGRHLTVVREDR